MAIYETILLIALLTGFTEAEMTLIDLTHDFDNTTTIYWPTAREDRFKLYQTVVEGSFYYESNTFSAAEHGGTHIDAPRHFAKGKQGVNEIPLSNLVGTAYIADFTKESNANADFQIEEKHLIAYEEKQGKIKDGDILLLYTGFSSHWPDLNAYLGTNTTDISLLHFPGLHPNASRWLVNNRKIKAVGIDTASIDYGQSTNFQSHVILFTHNIPAFENVNLDAMKKYKDRKDLMIFALPMKIKDGSGAPLRIIATFTDGCSSRATLLLPSIYLIFIICTLSFHMY